MVQPGDWVETGQVTAEISQPDIGNDLEVARAELVEAKAEYQKLQDFQERDIGVQKSYVAQKRQALAQQMDFVRSRLQWLHERETLETELRAKGLIERQRVVNTKIEINNATEELGKGQNEAKQLDLAESTLYIAKEKERLAQEDKVATAQRRVETLEDRLKRNSELVSPYSGYIVEFKVNAGEVVEPGRALFSVLPQERRSSAGTATSKRPQLQAKLYVRPEDGKKIRAGMQAQISPSTVKREEYGFIEGTVVQIAPIPSTQEGILRVLKNRELVQELSGGGAPFEVTIELRLDEHSHNGYKWSSSLGPDSELNPGTLSDGTITVRRIHLISLIIPALEQLFQHDET
jgi:HlyD family secretion protein